MYVPKLFRRRKGLGLHHSVDMRDARHPMRPHLAGITLPTYKVWPIGQILDQGVEGSCVGHGWTAWHNAKPTGYLHQRDHEYAFDWYLRAQQIDEWPGTNYEGTSVRAGARVGIERGLLSEYVWASGLDEIDTWLLGRGPLVLGVNWWSSLDDPDTNGFVTVDTSSGIRGGHCLLAFGKDLNGNYPLQQSWGEGFGKEGVIYMKPEDMQRWISGGGFTACAGIQTGVAA